MVAENPSAPEPSAPIYLDNLATTPVDPRVLEAMLPFFGAQFGNPSSKTHAFGWAAAEAVERARQDAAALIGASAREIVFTSGATEANHLALRGALAARGPGAQVVTCETEHAAVLDCLETVEGVEVVRLGVGPDGRLDPGRLEEALTERTALVSVMAANNEIGAVHPLAAIGEVARRHGVLWHCDAAQAVGKMPLDVQALGVDLLSFSGHKIYGPKGVGALYVRRRGKRVRLRPQTVGGGQEKGLRAGTLNVPGIVGLGEACRLCAEESGAEALELRQLRQRAKEILEGAGDVAFNGGDGGLPGCLSARFDGIDSGELLRALPDVALSAGAACSSGAAAPSHVLRAIGLTPAEALGSVRLGIGRFNTPAQVETGVGRLAAEVRRLRAEPQRENVYTA